MDETGMLDVISKAVAEETENPLVPMTRQTIAEDIPGWDSLAHVRIVYNLEARLGVKIDVVETYDIDNVGQLADMLLAKSVPK